MLIVNIELVSVGSSYFTAVEPKEIMGVPSQKKAAGIIMIHNHPCGEMKLLHMIWMLQIG
ncbi:hypothetical protein FPG78_05900 [Cardinium endosymbiont of Dermatophagoides farinae]|nr:hypothetical protein FPG78_05900 [Cardinium endosymbiont of Dermatophagoides farinae]